MKKYVKSCKLCPMISPGRHENGQRVFFCQHPDLINNDNHIILNIEDIYFICPLKEKDITICLDQQNHTLSLVKA